MKTRFHISILSVLFGIFCVVSDGMSELKIDSVYPTLGSCCSSSSEQKQNQLPEQSAKMLYESGFAESAGF
jgi:hypothetical protein